MSAQGIAIELTRITKDSGTVTKLIHLNPEGSIGNDSSRCAIGKGTMERLYLPDWRAFAKLIEETPRNSAYVLGVLRPDLPDSVPLVRKRDPKSAQPGSATRSKETIRYDAVPSLVLLDFDAKGMPQPVRLQLLRFGGFRGALEVVCPELATAGCISRMSTSANLVNEATGESHQSHGEHVYLLVQDGTDARRFLYTLHDRCWLAGLGWYIVGRAGQLLERSIIDKMVCAPERLVFEASPHLEPPLKQEKREATTRKGAPLDTRTACINLDKPGQAHLKRWKGVAARALKKEAAAGRMAFVEEKAGEAASRGMDPDKARLMAEQWGDSVLRPGVILEFDDRDLGAIDVAAILADPARFDGETLADPIEGVEYGRNCAIVQLRDAIPSIFSFAHGGARYKLRPEDEAPVFVEGGVEGADVASFRGNTAPLDFIRSDTGQILKGHHQNIRHAIQLLGVSLRHNEFSTQTEVAGLAGFAPPELNDPGAARLRFLIHESFSFLPPKDLFEDVLIDVAHLNRFHPVRDWLGSLVWDGVPRIDNWLIVYGGAENTAFNRAIGRIFLVAGVRRVRQPGCKFDTLLVLESPVEGKNKSQAAEILAMKKHWFTDGLSLDAEPKVVIEQTAGSWIIEFAELTGMHTRDLERIKAFLSRQVDKARAAYGRRAQSIPRQFVGIGTTNDTEYLRKDERRIWPVLIERFDLAKLRRDVEQLWAEAAYYEALGEPITLQEDLWTKAAEARAERKFENPYQRALTEWFGGQPWVTSNEVWEKLGIARDHRAKAARLVGEALRDLGFGPKQCRRDNDPKGCLRGDRFYEKPKT